MHDLLHLPYCTVALMHQCMIMLYARLWQNKRLKVSPNLAYKEQTKQANMEAETHKH